ncbi:MAG TPA: hypothetical protein VF941_15730 [Clostridia bacterium]
MEYIHRLPLISSTIAAIIIGLVNFKLGASNQDTYLRIAIGLIMFFFLGSYAKKFIIKIHEDVTCKLEKVEEDETVQVTEPKNDLGSIETSEKGHILDFVAGDDDDFTPLNISEAIKSKLRE